MERKYQALIYTGTSFMTIFYLSKHKLNSKQNIEDATIEGRKIAKCRILVLKTWKI